MGNSLRCCLACVLPCGALDLIRIVHLNGYVEEITRAGITAGEILNLYPNHVLSKPSSQGMVRKILILSAHTELKRGGIYFLIPNSSLPSSDHHHLSSSNKSTTITPPAHQLSSSSSSSKKIKTTTATSHELDHHKPKELQVDRDDAYGENNKCASNLEYLSALDHQNNTNKVEAKLHCEAKAKTQSGSRHGHQRRRSSRGKSGVWHPHLHAINED